jgi:hypothetical protein
MYYRVEDKYIIYEDQIAYLRMRLMQIMEKDSHGEGGGYLIRSIYFDDLLKSALFENESGIDERSKFRIRSYDRDDSFIRLEEKSKKSGFTHKESAVMSRDSVLWLIKNAKTVGSAPTASKCLLSEQGFLFKKLYTYMNTRLLHPVNIVEYEREAFVERAGNVRITFDRNICASDDVERFFDRDINGAPVMEKGAHILEVKYDEFLPDHIRKIIDTGSLQRTAFSKYTMAAKWREQNGECL